ncbi:MAG: outer membrane protein assembly factor BamB family protein [Shimia sp.]
MAVIEGGRGQGLLRRMALLASLALLAACGDPANAPLTGLREDVRPDDTALSGAVPEAPGLSLPATRNLQTWTHRASGADHRLPHLALSAAPRLIWSADIGTGNTRRARLTADPVSDGARLFTLDSRNRVAATSKAGSALWSVDLTPSTESRDSGSGGGLALGGGRLYVTTGFGELVALDPASGAEIWTQDLDAFGGAAPTYFEGIVYVAARDSTAWALDAEFGRILWQVTGTPSGSNLIGGPGVAVGDQFAVFPFPSGELVTTFRKGGIRAWNATVTSGRERRAYANVTDIASDPVIVGDTVYAGNQSGRVSAFALQTGELEWSANVGAYSPTLVTGGSVFAVTDRGRLVRLSGATGEAIWSVQLPFFTSDRPRRQKEVFAHYGPILAGGRLVVASSDGQLRLFDPRSGALVGQAEIPGGAASHPIVVNGTLYVVSARGQLHALR